MYKRMMVPIDLAHLDHLGKALETAAKLAKTYNIPVCYVGVTATTPGSVARTPQQFAQKLEAFGQEQASLHGVTATTKAVTSHDPTTDLDDTLLAAAKNIGADLVVMATHHPNLGNLIWPSHGGKVATHADASVFIVRDS